MVDIPSSVCHECRRDACDDQYEQPQPRDRQRTGRMLGGSGEEKSEDHNMRDSYGPNTNQPENGARRDDADRQNPNALVPAAGAQGSDRTELYNRLRAIIDDATQSVRSLKEENAGLVQRNQTLEERLQTLEGQLRLLNAGLTRDEQALKHSIDRLAQTLQMPVPAATAPREIARTPVNDAPAPASMPVAPVEEMPQPETQLPSEAPAMPEPAAEMDPPQGADEVTEPPAIAPAAEPMPERVPTPIDRGAETTEMPAASTATTTGGVYTLITYPFVRFSDLGQFQAALQRLQGVHDVQVRRFAQGTLEMTARYEGDVDLSTALRGLTAEIEEVSEEAPYRLRVRLRARADV
jgi:hypothetical protein